MLPRVSLRSLPIILTQRDFVSTDLSLYIGLLKEEFSSIVSGIKDDLLIPEVELDPMPSLYTGAGYLTPLKEKKTHLIGGELSRWGGVDPPPAGTYPLGQRQEGPPKE